MYKQAGGQGWLGSFRARYSGQQLASNVLALLVYTVHHAAPALSFPCGVYSSKMYRGASDKYKLRGHRHGEARQRSSAGFQPCRSIFYLRTIFSTLLTPPFYSPLGDTKESILRITSAESRIIVCNVIFVYFKLKYNILFSRFYTIFKLFLSNDTLLLNIY